MHQVVCYASEQHFPVEFFFHFFGHPSNIGKSLDGYNFILLNNDSQCITPGSIPDFMFGF